MVSVVMFHSAYGPRQAEVAEVFTYPGARHFYTDPCLADYHPASAGQTWQRVTTFLASL